MLEVSSSPSCAHVCVKTLQIILWPDIIHFFSCFTYTLAQTRDLGKDMVLLQVMGCHADRLGKSFQSRPQWADAAMVVEFLSNCKFMLFPSLFLSSKDFSITSQAIALLYRHSRKLKYQRGS